MNDFEGGQLPGDIEGAFDVDVNAAGLAITQIPELDGLTGQDRQEAMETIAELYTHFRTEARSLEPGARYGSSRTISIEGIPPKAILLIGTRLESGIDHELLWIEADSLDEVLAEENLLD